MRPGHHSVGMRPWLLGGILLLGIGGLGYGGGQVAWAVGEESQPSPEIAGPVHVLRIEGTIGPIVADYLDAELHYADEQRAQLLVMEMDTPGGLDTAMRQMVRSMLATDVPVAVYVSPAGARAASAGVFVLMAAQIAAMAPATNVGAAHPVNMGGQMDETMAEKVTNDAVAYLQGLAKQRGRNVEWSEKVVRESVSVTAEEAVALNVIDFVAKDLEELLQLCEGRRVAAAADTTVLRTVLASVVSRPLNWRGRFLQRITDPTVAYIFLLLGFYGLFFELSNPGSILPGIVGAICLLMAFLAFQSLPVNYVGVMLILVGLIMLLLEIKVTSYGALSIGGVVSLVLGSLLLFDPANPFGRVPLQVILPAVLFTVVFFVFIVGLGIAAQKRRHATGLEALEGQLGEIVQLRGEAGGEYLAKIYVSGELWDCRSSAPLATGASVRVIGRSGRILLVAPAGELSARS
jgi:membrane-bound serine protease (ClpP class)